MRGIILDCIILCYTLYYGIAYCTINRSPYPVLQYPLVRGHVARRPQGKKGQLHRRGRTPNLPASTKIIPTKIARLKISGKFPVDMIIPPLTIKILLESNPRQSTILVRRLAVGRQGVGSFCKQVFRCHDEKHKSDEAALDK